MLIICSFHKPFACKGLSSNLRRSLLVIIMKPGVVTSIFRVILATAGYILFSSMNQVSAVTYCSGSVGATSFDGNGAVTVSTATDLNTALSIATASACTSVITVGTAGTYQLSQMYTVPNGADCKYQRKNKEQLKTVEPQPQYY